MSKPEVKSENKCAHTQDQECIVLAAEMIIKIHRKWNPATTKGNPTPPLNAADGQTPDNEGTVFNPSKETNKLKDAMTIFDKTVVESVGITRIAPSNQKKSPPENDRQYRRSMYQYRTRKKRGRR